MKSNKREVAAVARPCELADAESGHFPFIAELKKRAMLEAYAEVGSITGAAAASGNSPRIHYYWLNDDEEYVEAFHVARKIYSEHLIAEVHRRATRAEKPSDILLMFATKGFRPEYHDNYRPEINIAVQNNGGIVEFDFETFSQILKA